MIIQKQNKSALLWGEFCPMDRKPAQKALGEGQDAEFVHKC